MNNRYTRLVIGLLIPLLLSCGGGNTPAAPSVAPVVPSPELYSILQQFLAADTLNDYPKIHLAFIRPDTVAGQVSIHLLDEYNSGGKIKAFPLTAWNIDGKIIFVLTGLETVASGGDTTYHHLIREVALANEDKIWHPHFRCWRIDVLDQEIVHIDRQVAFNDFHGLNRIAPPPPLPVLSRP